MPLKFSNKTIDEKLIKKVAELSGQDIGKCMQCGTCSASCPMNVHAAATPRHIMHLIQFGQSEALDHLNMPWLCASCHTCEVRCPRGLDIPKVMEALRQIKLRQNVDHVEPSNLQPEEIVELPQIAMVSGFRKFTS